MIASGKMVVCAYFNNLQAIRQCAEDALGLQQSFRVHFDASASQSSWKQDVFIVYKNNCLQLCYECVPNLCRHKTKTVEGYFSITPYFALFFMTGACRGLQWPVLQFLKVKKSTVFPSTPCADIQNYQKEIGRERGKLLSREAAFHLSITLVSTQFR